MGVQAGGVYAQSYVIKKIIEIEAPDLPSLFLRAKGGALWNLDPFRTPAYFTVCSASSSPHVR